MLQSTPRIKPDTQDLFVRVHQLESLLAASELDNEKLYEEIKLLQASKNRQKMELEEQLKTQTIEMVEYKEKVNLLEIQITKKQKAMAIMEDYIKMLPSQEELDEVNTKVKALSSEHKHLKTRMKRVTGELNSTQKELISKEQELQNAILRIEELMPYEEAQQMLLQEACESKTAEKTELEIREESMSYFSNEGNIFKLVTIQKAQLIQSQKLIQGLRTKINVKEAEKNDLTVKVADKVRMVGELQEQLMCSQLENERLFEKSKLLEQSKYDLEKQCSELKESIEELECLQRTKETETTKLVNLATQIELCHDELKQVIELGKTIVNNEEPEISSLLGFSSSSTNQETIHTSETNFNVEWILQKLVTMCQLRKQLHEMRSILTSVYTDSLSKDMEKCNVQ